MIQGPPWSFPSVSVLKLPMCDTLHMDQPMTQEKGHRPCQLEEDYVWNMEIIQNHQRGVISQYNSVPLAAKLKRHIIQFRLTLGSI